MPPRSSSTRRQRPNIRSSPSRASVRLAKPVNNNSSGIIALATSWKVILLGGLAVLLAMRALQADPET